MRNIFLLHIFHFYQLNFVIFSYQLFYYFVIFYSFTLFMYFLLNSGFLSINLILIKYFINTFLSSKYKQQITNQFITYSFLNLQPFWSSCTVNFIIKMKPRQNPFRISALNSLKVHQVHIKDEKQMVNTFKGGNDLRNQLNKNKNSSLTGYKKTLANTKQFSQTVSNLQKPQSQTLMDQVAALDNFKVPVTRQKTKNLIQNIKLRRRQKHIEAYNNFKQDLDDYKENLLQIYESLYNDCSQVLSIKQSQLSGYFNSQTDEYLLSREKDIIRQFEQELQTYKKTSKQKIVQTKQELQRIKNSRGTVVHQTCEYLKLQLIDIAFILQNEAIEIENKQKENINKIQSDFYNKYENLITQIQTNQESKNTIMEQKMNQVIKRWKQIKQSYEIQQFQKAIQSQQYINSPLKQKIYNKLIKLQQQNHSQKKKYLQSLINEHVDSYKKVNIQKWNQIVKSINQTFDKKLDDLVQQLVQEHNKSKSKHQKLIQHLQSRLLYIQNHNLQEVKEMITNKFQPLVDKNVTQSQQIMKNATSYVQLNDQKQNTLLQNLYKFFLSIGNNNDQFLKDFTALCQKYQLEKAKILDDDQELVQKLNNELQNFKKQLRQSLHHIKLEEVQKRCFQKIDQIQIAYRKTHNQNKQLTASRPSILTKFMQTFEQKMAFVFQLYEQSKRNELIERNKQDAEKQAIRRIQQEDKKKLQEQERQAQLIKKQGGKAPPPAKPKDPKKLAAELEQRKKAILAEMGQKKIQQLKTGSGNTWLVYKALDVMSKEFYKNVNQQAQLSEPAQNAEQKTQNQEPPKILQVDQLPEPVLNSQGHPVTTKQSIFKIQQVSQYLLSLRDKVFQNINVKKSRILVQSSKNDQQMMEESLTMLDDRLKKHYSLKGQLQAQIFVKRSGQITNHKKRYQKYARTVRQKMDLQTQRFNFLLQKSLENLKNHNAAQKQLKQQMPTGKNLSQLQGILSKARQNYNKFTNEINQIVAQLNHLAKTQVDILLQKNIDFIKQSRLIKDGGQYSEQQIKWYEQMMGQITTQIKAQQTKRQQKSKQIQQQSQKRKKQLLQKIQKDYHSSIQELSAKEGTGKTYGKPKRIAQQKIRLQMNKCEQSQISINKQIDNLVQTYQKQRSHSFKFQQRPQTIKWRRNLMTLWTCIDRYAKHLQALKKELKIKPMIRVNYDQNLPQCTVTSQQEDKKLVEQQLKTLGPLGAQKQDKPFMKFILDIEKIISDQSRTIYVGDKAKYLTGADKIPDFLRKYIASMKQSAQDFRQNSIRQLRQSCIRLSDLCQNLCQLFFSSIQSYFIITSNKNFSTSSKQFSEVYNKHDIQKTQNLRQLRPNLSNPKCQDELKKLNDKELARQVSFIQQINVLKQQFKSGHFTNGEKFMNCLINNYQFLLFYCDSLLLFEDFVKVNGDDDEDKKKLNIKKLMVMKQKGINIDSSSERNLNKKWTGVNFTIINFDDKKFSYKKVQVQDPAAKDPKKAAKKDAKKPANQPAQQTENATNSKQIETFKTWRQKSVYESRQHCLQQFRKVYTQNISQMYANLDQSLKQNEMFNKKWTKIASQLFLK